MARPPIHSQIRNGLRQVWMRSVARQEAQRAARVRRGVYVCAECGEEFGPKDITIDHLVALGPSPGSRRDDGTATWDSLIRRMFCDSDSLRAVCRPCHTARTAEQRARGEL